MLSFSNDDIIALITLSVKIFVSLSLAYVVLLFFYANTVNIIVQIHVQSGGYVLGFRLDPVEKLKDVGKEIQSLHQVYSSSPLFGIDFEADSTKV